MARIVKPEDLPAPRKSRAKKQAARDDLGTLMPDRTITIAGKRLTVREYRFREGMQLRAIAEPIISQLAELATDFAEGSFPLEKMEAVMDANPDAIVQLIAQSCDQDPAWVRDLPGGQGDALFNTWWAVNSGFFVHRVQQRVLLRRMAASAGRMSSPPSSPTATTSDGLPQTSTPNAS